MEAKQLLLKYGEDLVRIFIQNKAIVLKITFSNQRIAEKLREAGVPLITQSAEQAQMVYLAKKAKWAMQSGGGAVRNIPMQTTNSVISGTGKKINLPRESSVNGLEIFDSISQLPMETNVVYLRLEHRPTENSLEQGKTKPSFSLKAYFIPKPSVDEKMKKGTGSKKFSLPEAREVLKELIDVTFLVNVFQNPSPVSTTVFSLFRRQPDNSPTLKSSPFSFFKLVCYVIKNQISVYQTSLL